MNNGEQNLWYLIHIHILRLIYYIKKNKLFEIHPSVVSGIVKCMSLQENTRQFQYKTNICYVYIST